MSRKTAALDVERLQLDTRGLEQLFFDARSQNAWQDVPVDDAVLRELYDIVKMAPTSANSQPMRVVFVKGAAAKARLMPALAPQNVGKTMAAPVTAIIAHDLKFYDQLPKLLPHVDARSWFLQLPPADVEQAALHGGTMQGAYLIIAARALGLDCGPIGGFDKAAVDAAFFPDGQWKSNFLVNLGYGDPSGVFARSPRLTFDEACRIE
jgi:3-hydroxypropanoate dehydrogenase